MLAPAKITCDTRKGKGWFRPPSPKITDIKIEKIKRGKFFTAFENLLDLMGPDIRLFKVSVSFSFGWGDSKTVKNMTMTREEVDDYIMGKERVLSVDER